MVAPLAASTIDVTDASSVTLASGDELLFSFGIGNFGRYAAGAGPSRIGFTFSSVLENPLFASLSAALQSTDGAFSILFDSPIPMEQGAMRSRGYNGSVAVWRSSIDLGDDAVEQLFGPEKDVSAYLVLRNLGDEIALGLPGYTMAQSMAILAAKGGLNVGTPYEGIFLEKRPEIRGKLERESARVGTETPEPELFLPVAIGLSGLLGARLRKSGRSA